MCAAACGTSNPDTSKQAAADARAEGPDVGADAATGGDAGASAVDASTPDATFLGEAGAPRSFTVTNRCAQTVWAAALPATTFPGGTVAMAPGDSFQVGVDDGWSGRIWGKVECTTGPAPKNQLACASDPFPSSLAEFTLTKTLPTGLDFYDLSLVDGFNLPIAITALGHTADAGHPYNCGSPSCAPNLNATCPQVLQDGVDGGVLACANDECKILGDNDASSPDCVYPNTYTEFFKTACPTAYSFPSDDPTSTFTCEGRNDYAVVFCP